MTCTEFRDWLAVEECPSDRAWHDHRVTCESCLMWLEELRGMGFDFAEIAMGQQPFSLEVYQ